LVPALLSRVHLLSATQTYTNFSFIAALHDIAA
jgi:hypothetical protein